MFNRRNFIQLTASLLAIRPSKDLIVPAPSPTPQLPPTNQPLIGIIGREVLVVSGIEWQCNNMVIQTRTIMVFNSPSLQENVQIHG